MLWHFYSPSKLPSVSSKDRNTSSVRRDQYVILARMHVEAINLAYTDNKFLKFGFCHRPIAEVYCI